jgi:hypothetical protein
MNAFPRCQVISSFFYSPFYKNDYSQHRFLISFPLVIFHDVSHIRSEIFSMQFRSCAQLAAEKKGIHNNKRKTSVSCSHIQNEEAISLLLSTLFHSFFCYTTDSYTYNNENKKETTWRCHDPMNERAKGQSIGTRSKELNVVIVILYIIPHPHHTIREKRSSLFSHNVTTDRFGSNQLVNRLVVPHKFNHFV